MFNNMLPTKDNSVRRGMILSYLILCPGGCEIDEDIDHMMVGRCVELQALWWWLKLHKQDFN
jgi:hypothetical protein